jgi:hypothetical protein
MLVKSKPGAYDISRPEAGNSGNLSHSSPSKVIDLVSSKHRPSPSDELILSQTYTNLQKAKTPSRSTLPQPDLVSEPKKTWIGPLNEIPLQTCFPGEEPQISSEIPNPALEVELQQLERRITK